MSAVHPRRPAPGRSLAELFPELAAQWDAQRNGGVMPYDVTPGSNCKAWWRCSSAPDHVWDAVIRSRSTGCGCPYCANRRVCASNNLAALYPALVRSWHPTRNGALRPVDVVPESPRSVWWKCDEARDHEWRAQIRNRTGRGDGCPFCSRRRPSSTNNLAQSYPNIARFWDSTKNGPLRPRSVSPRSEMKIWWRCSSGPDHEWQQTIKDCIRRGACPFCRNRRPSRTNCLATTHPRAARLWHPTKNGSLTAQEVVAGSTRRVWWKCNRGPDHEWRGFISVVARSSSCPFCLGRRASVTNSLARRFPLLARQWHPCKNGRLKPSDVPAGSERYVWWKCPAADDHEWQAQALNRVRYPRCPFCSHKQVALSTSLATTHPRVARLWHPRRNGGLSARAVVPGASAQVWWRCPAGSDHLWKGRVDHAVKALVPCPFCAGRRVSVTNSLAKLFPKVAREWNHTRNSDITAADVLAASNDLVWWRCVLGHEWRARVRERTVDGKGCPVCADGGLRREAERTRGAAYEIRAPSGRRSRPEVERRR